jgi:hypothetical protein
MNTIPVALFSDRAEAELVRQRLAELGFEASLSEGTGLTKPWLISDRAGCVRVEVPAQQFNKAEQFLIEWDAAEGAPRQAIRCPECGSFRVDYPQYAKHSLLTNLTMGLMAQLHFIEREFYCDDCHFTWLKAGTRPSRVRRNSAPFYFIDGVEQNALQREGPIDTAGRAAKGGLTARAKPSRAIGRRRGVKLG